MSDDDAHRREMFAQLDAIAPDLNRLVKDPNAAIHYDMFSGGLWWSDERLASGACTDVLRYLLYYRSKLVDGSAEPGHPEFWLTAKEKFPSWPGFADERCGRDEALAAFQERSGRRALFSIDLTDIIFRLEKEFQGMVPSKIIERHAYGLDPPDISVGELHDLTCRCMRLAGKEVPVDAWERVRKCVSESLGVEQDRISKESCLTRDLIKKAR
jgi:hypothetical protein